LSAEERLHDENDMIKTAAANAVKQINPESKE